MDAFRAVWTAEAIIADIESRSRRVVAFIYGALAMLVLVSAAQWIGGNSDWAYAGWGALAGIAGIWIATKENR